MIHECNYFLLLLAGMYHCICSLCAILLVSWLLSIHFDFCRICTYTGDMLNNKLLGPNKKVVGSSGDYVLICLMVC